MLQNVILYVQVINMVHIITVFYERGGGWGRGGLSCCLIEVKIWSGRISLVST